MLPACRTLCPCFKRRTSSGWQFKIESYPNPLAFGLLESGAVAPGLGERARLGCLRGRPAPKNGEVYRPSAAFFPSPRGRVLAHSRASALPETMRPMLGAIRAIVQKLSAIGIIPPPRFAAEKWVMRDDDPLDGALSRFLWSWGARVHLCTKKPPAVLRRAGGGIFGKPYLVSSRAAWAAARRATGTRNGEQLT